MAKSYDRQVPDLNRRASRCQRDSVLFRQSIDRMPQGDAKRLITIKRSISFAASVPAAGSCLFKIRSTNWVTPSERIGVHVIPQFPLGKNAFGRSRRRAESAYRETDRETN